MAPHRWTTEAQFEFLSSYTTRYLEHQRDQQLPAFWTMINHAWFENYPERRALFGPDHDLSTTLSDQENEQLKAAIVARQKVR